MTAKKIIKEIEDNFFEKLQQKTNYGRNELKDIYRQSVNEVL